MHAHADREWYGHVRLVRNAYKHSSNDMGSRFEFTPIAFILT